MLNTERVGLGCVTNESLGWNEMFNLMGLSVVRK